MTLSTRLFALLLFTDFADSEGNDDARSNQSIAAAGRLHLVELALPQANQEGMMLGFARLVWGVDAVLPHCDGSWIRLLSQGALRA